MNDKIIPMDENAKAELLAQALVMAEGELNQMFRRSPQAKDGDRTRIRHDAYLTVIKRWMKNS